MVSCIYWLIGSMGGGYDIVVCGRWYEVGGVYGVCRNVIGLFSDWIIIW